MSVIVSLLSILRPPLQPSQTQESSLHDLPSDESDDDSDSSFTCHTRTVVKDSLDVDLSVETMVIAEIMSGVELALSDGISAK